MEGYMSAIQAAERLGITSSGIRAAYNRGTIDGSREGGALWFRVEEVERYRLASLGRIGKRKRCSHCYRPVGHKDGAMSKTDGSPLYIHIACVQRRADVIQSSFDDFGNFDPILMTELLQNLEHDDRLGL